MEYNFTKLWSTQFFGFYEFKDFFEYASHKESQINYYKKFNARYIDKNGEKEVEMPQQMIEGRVEANESALEMIKNLLIVFLFTRYEFIVQDAVKSLLCDNGERILKIISVYPEYKDVIGFSLKEFLKSESKDAYIILISERLSSHILNGKPSNVLKRLRCLLEFDNVNDEILDELMNRRNTIVHEGHLYTIDLNELENYYDIIDNLLKTLALALRKQRIVVIDEGNILDENEDK